ncbi:ABC transporter permease (plasmid) [Deinococcus metallilatus]|uniref:ABC transporter permease n=1 Tax=Deinococcus metallilatus TaxID=1211322 RepID=A0AAJ5F5W3_9DEIO|nr:ABC transporter permease [Deinococcus metallilatus]MBB5293476.1 peptide/nickel transport system permease protein [Deinococcus metallilatus]QBY06559.1 ABC transporter permease [Deinococcus metallilatus]RXJ17902.1 ABC transporter permease [Deinococcus metallilatus]TLK32174.1 ABC transporter permease [Deinococcus metallilatus]GMA15304.1 peptide ABC transporter permease [Deinococcus metallilatus]
MTDARALPAARPARGKSRGLLARIVRHPVGLAALLLLLVLYGLAFLGPLIYRVSPITTDPLHTMAAPSPEHLLGTDELGRDVLARLLYGGRITLLISVVSMVVALSVGSLVGALAGYHRGWLETALMRLVDTFLAIPSFFLILAALAVLGNSPPVVVLVVGLGFWPSVARIVHAEVSKIRNFDFVEAERALGASSNRIIWRHVFPQALPSAAVLTTLGIAWSILTETGLSYLGLGIQPPLSSWGNMLQNAQTYFWVKPALAVYPGVLIALAVLSFNLLGNVLRDLTDPRSRS